MPELTEKVDYIGQYQSGIQNFAKLFRHWMDGNGWSHPVMTGLLRASLNGCGWLHSSQISGFRHGTTRNPGPRAFVAMERLNFFLHRYETEKLLIPNTSNSNHYSKPLVLLEDGAPPPLGWWFEIFCGARIPKEYDVSGSFFTDQEAAQLTRNLARYLRRQLTLANFDPVDDTSRVLQDYFQPTGVRRARLHEIILGKGDTFTGEEFQRELPHLIQLSASLNGPSTEDDFLDALSNP